MDATFQQWPTDKLVPSPYNSRKTFNTREDVELAETVEKHGILQPLRIRSNGKPGFGEIVFGERRWRAAQKVGLETVPVLHVELTDDEVIEQLLIENLQRKDIHPLEEGEGYHVYLHEHGYTLEQLIAKTKKSKGYIYGRIKLARELHPLARKAVVEGKLSVSVAELIARVDTELQEQCTKEVLGISADERDVEQLGIERERVVEDGVILPLSFDATRSLIRRRYSTKLANAKFDPQDATLTAAGACTVCPHRSSNQPELPGLAGPKTDLCTKPSCFEQKSQAQWERTVAAADARGMRVATEKEAATVFAFDGVTVAQTSPFVDLTTELTADLQRQPGKRDTFGKLLAKHLDDIPRVLVQDGSGAPRELLDRKAAVAKLRELGKIDKPDKAKPGKPTSAPKSAAASASPAGADEADKERAKQELKESALLRLLGALAEKVEGAELGRKETAAWRWLAHALLDHVAQVGEVPEVFFKRRGDSFDVRALDKEIDACRTTGELRAFVIELLMATLHEGVILGTRQQKERFDDGCELFGVSFDEQIELAKKAAKAEAEADEAKADSKKSKKGKS